VVRLALHHLMKSDLHSPHVLCARGGRNASRRRWRVRSGRLDGPTNPFRGVTRKSISNFILLGIIDIEGKLQFFGDIPIPLKISHTASSSYRKIPGGARNIRRLRNFLIAFCGNTLYLFVWALHPSGGCQCLLATLAITTTTRRLVRSVVSSRRCPQQEK
jgi:hypothetical protein